MGGSGQSVLTISKVNGGFNGGGYNYDSGTDYNTVTSSGGGATDIRLDANDLYHRIIVAGGGGGANTARIGGYANGGVGGGIIGGKSTIRIINHWGGIWNETDGSGGTQTEGGHVGYSNYSDERNTAPRPNGTFGFGGNIEGYNIMGGPGGGGWYGGGAGNGHGGAGAGGSGFTLNESTVVNTPKNYAFKSKSDAFLKSSLTLSGSEKMFSPSHEVVYGNRGHGYARITILTKYQKTTKNCPIYRNTQKMIDLS